VASCSGDFTIKIWDTLTWSPIQTLSGHSGIVYQIEQIDNDTIASASADLTCIIWKISTGAQITSKTFLYQLWVVKYIPSSGFLAVGLQGSFSENLLTVVPQLYQPICLLKKC
jgi:WD40 repeat protein